MSTVGTTAERPRWGRRGTAAATIAARLSIESVLHDYDGVASLRGVTLEARPGEIVCLLGHSGCGKSTLLRLVAGLERPTSGRIVIGDLEVAGPARFVPPERRGVGLMFQDYALFPHMSILANVMFGLTSLDGPAAERAARAALGRVGLEDYAEDYPHALSGGEQQRVALARAIVPRPAVLLMDEPFSGLDKRLRDSVRDETMAVLRETRATAVVVTHDPEEAMRMADRVALMRKGSLVQFGSPAELYGSPVDLTAARFFSELNEFDGTATGGRVETPFGAFDAGAASDGAAMVVCIRHSGILLAAPGSGGVAGRVVRSRFLGEVWLAEIAVDGLDALLRARVRDASAFPPGTDVAVDVDRRDVLVFPR
ncbi:ABC transporter ATP-binding protein [Oharaeibacter diazotrophicus]|uniref:Iron(III) transport system ATP-binding protein n=1 Tax=Oharaeibacter diazotrophicus TaxID=1920512 RepID=A0A4R6RK93_9HYPH|nr:ABC transporter ATP-binding protein [Oharaeibacter diazotrophicus]TDP87009.1 iron(III) transport system ATP-binding protein [Oharaeibacter diazotrophicus]BBE71048.1 spermidine/putrescine import ATP-binding protein PotA [Pleomorphomonas sp. SM30]GLS77798.1 iron ABC transporter ATP-binding protein [Oharaeibacter diazotrophicus]